MFVGSARVTPLAASSGVAVRMRCSLGARGLLDIDVVPAPSKFHLQTTLGLEGLQLPRDLVSSLCVRELVQLDNSKGR